MVIQNGSLRLFRIFGISVFLHWSWALIALYELQARTNTYTTQFWNIAEYLTLFAIVLLHEFGHALACRSVGGTAERIMLWPLGGVAYVNPPPRPGALLWSIAAGPLVNVVLVPITFVAMIGWGKPAFGDSPDVYHYLSAIRYMNAALLVLNLLPIYPLDGGQILRAILWFFVGRIRSLTIAAAIGLVAGAAGVVLAAYTGEIWFVILAGFVGLQSWHGLKAARAMSAALAVPRYAGVRCPRCHEPPPIGAFWRCPCGAAFDAFEHQMVCPRCRRTVDRTICAYCGEPSSPIAWYATQRTGQTFIWTQAVDGNTPNQPGV
jgi:Zn-dependent protease